MARTVQVPFFDATGTSTAENVGTTNRWLHYFHVVNSNLVDAYIQLFNALAADVTVGTTAPNQSYLVPAGNGVDAGAFEASFPDGLYFSTALSFACTTTPTGNGNPTTALTVNMSVGGG